MKKLFEFQRVIVRNAANRKLLETKILLHDLSDAMDFVKSELEKKQRNMAFRKYWTIYLEKVGAGNEWEVVTYDGELACVHNDLHAITKFFFC